MRPGVIISIVGHVGAVMMTYLAWETRTVLVPSSGAVVPVEIVDIAPESNVRALAEAVPEDELSPTEQETRQAEEQPASATRQPQRPRQRNDAFDLDAVAGLVDQDRPDGRPRNPGAPAETTRAGAGLGTDDVVRIEDRARSLIAAHMRRCWRMPIDLPDPDRLVVVVEFEINRNGTLNGQPRVTSPRPGSYTFDPAMRTAVDNAVRAVRACDPYPLADDPAVGEHYEIWRSQVYTFRPRTN